MATVPYRKGYTIAPYEISALGIVTFTDGTNTGIIPNQVQCEAYGYTYDEEQRVCRAQTFTPKISKAMDNVNNTIRGNNNDLGMGINNSIVVGENNSIKGISRNNIVVGNANEIVKGINNSVVLGTLGEVTTENSIVLGANNTASDILGERQSIQLIYGRQTTDNSTVDAYLNNTSGSYFEVPEDSAIYFQSETLALRVGGTAGGSVGDFKSWVERGVVLNVGGTLSIDRSRTSPASSGTTTGWSPINSVSGSNFLQTVKGATNMTISWVSNIRITQMKPRGGFPS
tara:strand:+ start:7279 stop:8136 length:858 start_codon:yes stop_codon:yes gene_type:complete